ncbi:hypothetical protein [Saccharopolyspora hattusasensis]
MLSSLETAGMPDGARHPAEVWTFPRRDGPEDDAGRLLGRRLRPGTL